MTSDFNKYSEFLNSLKDFNFKESSTDELKSLITKANTLETELSNEKVKTETNISHLEDEIKKIKNDICQYYPNINDLELSNLETLLDNEIKELINNLSV